MSLEEKKQKEALLTLCVNVIVKNFEKFMFVYKSGDYELHYLFGLLQREKKISILLLEKLLRTDKFQKYVDFFLNSYVEEIDLKSAVFDDVAPILGRLIKIASTITLLDLPFSNYANSLLSELVSSLSKVESLTLRGRNISEDVFRSIGNNCWNLKTLIIECDDATDECIEALYDPNDSDKCNLNKVLEHLYLTEDVTTTGLKYALKNFQSLLTLEHHDVFQAIYELHANDVFNDSRNLRKYNLRKLKIPGDRKYPVKFVELCGKCFPHLTMLEIYDLCCQERIDTFKIFPSLKEITFGHISNSCNLSSFFQEKGSDLKKLSIFGGTMSLDSLLKFFPKLEYLSIADNYLNIENEHLTSCCSFQYCKELSLGWWNFRKYIHGQFVKSLLSRCPNLKDLSFYGWDWKNRSLDANFMQFLMSSANCIKTLKTIRFSYTHTELSAVKYFVENAFNLETVLLSECHLTANDVKYLKQLKPSVIYINEGRSNEWDFL